MNNAQENKSADDEWFAIRTRREFRLAEQLGPHCSEVFFPTHRVVTATDRRPRLRPVIPHVMFVRAKRDLLLALERHARLHPEELVPFWIYRHPGDNTVRPIPHASIELLRLLTSDDDNHCEIFNKTDFRPGQRVRVTSGKFAGYEGTIQRVRRNRHVVVRIEGICMVLLPYIHPDLLEPLD